jgi:hypothetical protein
MDNNSSDGSPEMIRNEFPQLTLICTGSNLGFAKANNIGIKKSFGRYLCLINSDIQVLNNSIDLMVNYMDQHPEIGVLGPKVLNSDLTLQPNFGGFPTLWTSFCRALALDRIFPHSKVFGGERMTFFSGDNVCSVDTLDGLFLLVRKEALDAVGLLDEDFFMYFEDVDWCKRFHKVNWGIVYYPEAMVIHYGGASSSNDPIKFYLQKLRAGLLYWRKYNNRISQLIYLLIVLLHHSIRVSGWIFGYVIRPSEKDIIRHKINRSMACIYWLLNISRSKLN